MQLTTHGRDRSATEAKNTYPTKGAVVSRQNYLPGSVGTFQQRRARYFNQALQSGTPSADSLESSGKK